VQVRIRNEPDGRPLVSAPGGADLRVSIAHTPYVGVGVVAEGEEVGIDVERVEPRSERFAAAAFLPEELEVLLEGRDPAAHDEWLARGWAAKEAAAKADGTGLAGRPKEFVVRAMEQDVLTVNDRRLRTAALAEHVVAWTLPSRGQGGST
jgi:phosphopantetheinyl transferase